MKIVIALGSNLGDREAIINSALEELAAVITISAVSSLYETEPFGVTDQPKYLNAVLIGECDRDPHELLQLMLQIEARLGRVRVKKWDARTLDLDLIVVEDYAIDSAELTLPHPLAHQRKFVLEPWLEIDPVAYLPGHGKVSDILAGLS